MSWFFSAAQRYPDPAGRPAYRWDYAYQDKHVEDAGHGSLDVEGLHQAYLSDRYGITSDMMAPLVNTFTDVMTKGTGHYAGRVDGTDGTGSSAPGKDVRSGWLLLAEFQPASYQLLLSPDLPGGNSGAVDQFAAALLAKSRHNRA